MYECPHFDANEALRKIIMKFLINYPNGCNGSRADMGWNLFMGSHFIRNRYHAVAYCSSMVVRFTHIVRIDDRAESATAINYANRSLWSLIGRKNRARDVFIRPATDKLTVIDSFVINLLHLRQLNAFQTRFLRIFSIAQSKRMK